ncbi:predicted protein [Paecilomyces variotii No. 5]|uniref:Fungal-specific transcription factor domain-containing protein n=1 Tax=Byssochlamys spectabilis (strain No. 5 / NBRC 109023) TaxID=1356009 RepID=V5G1I5_BYSSN|nr:predicted protein [Paecilomyces variotii No. 5]
MKRRGPKCGSERGGSNNLIPRTSPVSQDLAPRSKAGSESIHKGVHDDIEAMLDNVESLVTPSNQHISPPSQALRTIPRHLNPKQALLFDRYINRFSRIYPSCQTSSNPFLSTLLPMALESDFVLTALLALSGTQTWGVEWDSLQQETLRAKQHTIEICRKTLSGIYHEVFSPHTLNPTASAELLRLMACITIMLIYEKLSGEDHHNWKPHLDFIGHIFNNAEMIFPLQYQSSEEYQFLFHLFAYNDLVASTSLRTRTLSQFYIDVTTTALLDDETYTDQYYFPSLIARLNAGDRSITLSHIRQWGGKLNWFPSHCLERSRRISSSGTVESVQCSDYDIVAEIYRAAAIIHYTHTVGAEDVQFPCCMRDHCDSFHYHRHAVRLLNLLPVHSPVGNILLWPISIIAPDLMSEHTLERESVARLLYNLEKHFQMRHFRRTRETLREIWRAKDCGLDSRDIMQGSILQG